MTTPIDTIISVFENKAKEIKYLLDEGLLQRDKIYSLGKADGYQEAANFLKDLQKLFN